VLENLNLISFFTSIHANAKGHSADVLEKLYSIRINDKATQKPECNTYNVSGQGSAVPRRTQLLEENEKVIRAQYAEYPFVMAWRENHPDLFNAI